MTDLNTLTAFAIPTLDQAVEYYLLVDLADHHPATIAWNKARLDHLTRLLPGVSLAELMPGHLKYAQAEIAKHHYSPNYAHSIIRCWRQFLRFAHEFDLITADLSPALRLPRLPQTGRKGITDADIQAVYASLQSNYPDWYTTRDLAIIRLLHTSGIRAAGLCNLTLSDLDLDHQRFTVTEKFGKQRAAFTTPAGVADLRAWLAIRDARKTQAVFVTHLGSKLLPVSLYQIVKRRAKLAGLSEQYSPHQWRHAFARTLAQRGMPLGLIAQLMGHTDVSITVKHYGIFATHELQENYDRYMEI